MEELFSVYALPDALGRVTAIDGGYTISNIRQPERWVRIDQGRGERFALCQSLYLPGPLTDARGRFRYRLEDGKLMERTAQELDSDPAEPEPEPSLEDDLLAMVIDHELRLTLIELEV